MCFNCKSKNVEVEKNKHNGLPVSNTIQVSKAQAAYETYLSKGTVKLILVNYTRKVSTYLLTENGMLRKGKVLLLWLYTFAEIMSRSYTQTC